MFFFSGDKEAVGPARLQYDTYVGRDFRRFSLSSSVTRLARLEKEETEEQQLAGERRGQEDGLVRAAWRGEGHLRLSNDASGPQPSGQQQNSPSSRQPFLSETGSSF